MPEPPRLHLAQLPTPIHRLPRISAQARREILVWRDDLTGCAESGNKVRKLEYLLAEAVGRGASAVITCGAPQSNHARATVLLARRLGLEVSVIVREPPEGIDETSSATGNWFLNRMAGATIRTVPFETYRAAGSVYDSFLDEEAARLRGLGLEPSIIAEGGSSPLGCFGYRSAIGEMLETWRRAGLPGDAPDAIFFALGSGGTHAGLVLGAQAHGLEPRTICAVNVCNDRGYFMRRVGDLIERTCERYELPKGQAELRIFDGHVRGGYARTTDDDLRFFCRVAREEGIILDPCYTGKAFRGMLAELERDPDAFGERILFLHTGGVFSNYAYAAQYERVMDGGAKVESRK